MFFQTPEGCNKELHKDVLTLADVKYTRGNRKASSTEQHKSAITDHVVQENHIIKWDEAKILDRDSNTFSRRIREAIEIRKKGPRQLTVTRARLLYIMYMIHCCVQLRTLGKRTTCFLGKAVNQDTCDQAISQDGKSLSLSVFNSELAKHNESNCL